MPDGREVWYADGWQINPGLVRDVEAVSVSTPPVAGSSATLYGRTGEAPRRAVHGPGRFVLNIWVGESTRTERDALWDDLVRAMCQAHRYTLYRRVMPDGSSRYCDGRVVQAVAPERIGQQGYRASFEIDVPAGYWRGPRVDVSRSRTGTTTRVTLPEVAHSTAPIETGVYRLFGPFSSCSVRDTTPGGAGDVFTYAAAVGAGQYVIVNSGNWAVNGQDGAVADQDAFTYSGFRFMALGPGGPGTVPTLDYVTSGGGSGARLDMDLYPSFLV